MKSTHKPTADQRLDDCRQQIVSAIESNELSDRMAANLLDSLAVEYRAGILLEPLPSDTPKVFSGNLPERPKLPSALGRLISGA